MKRNHQTATEPSTALNAVCPYYTMFPLEFPISVLKRIGPLGRCCEVSSPFRKCYLQTALVGGGFIGRLPP